VDKTKGEDWRKLDNCKAGPEVVTRALQDTAVVM